MSKLDKIKKIFSREYWPLVDQRYGLGALERIVNSNWYNPFASLWLNLRSFPLGQALRMPVAVYGRPRLNCLSGHMRIEGKVIPGMIRFNASLAGSPSNTSAHSDIFNAGTMIFEGPCFIATGCRICVWPKAEMRLGAKTKIADYSNIVCARSIVLEEGVRLTHRCQVFDSNFHYIADLDRREIKTANRPVRIGRHSWVCNSVTISPGAVLPEYSIVCSNSVVNKDFSAVEPCTLFGGIPAKPIRGGMVRVKNPDVELEIIRYLNETGADAMPIDETYTPERLSANGTIS